MGRKTTFESAAKWIPVIFAGPGKMYHVEIHNETVIDYLEAASAEGEVVETYLTEIITKSILSTIKNDTRKLKLKNR